MNFLTILFEAIIGLAISGGLYAYHATVGYGFFLGFLVVLIVDVFFTLRTRIIAVYPPKKFLKVFFRANMQKIVLYGLLIAGALRYSRPDLVAFTCGLVVMIFMGRVLNLLGARE